MEVLPSSSSVAKTPALVSTSTSGSIHNRLVASSSSSARRSRAQSVAESDDEKLAGDLANPKPSTNVLRSLPSSPKSPTLPLYDASRSAPPPRQPILRWILLSYGILSMVFFTSRLLGISRQLPQNSLLVSSNLPVSPINDFSDSYRLSKLVPLKSQLKSFRPYAIRSITSVNASDVTACLWTTEEELYFLERWSVQWKGPISIVISTNNTQEAVLAKLEKSKHAPWSSGSMLVHVVQKTSEIADSSNTYLNIARMLARTQYVLLFPSSPRLRMPGMLYNQITAKITSNNTTMKHPHLIVPEKLTPHTPFPFHFSPPLLMQQSHPLWCSERFFSSPSREEEWEECLWQFWLHSHGTLQSFIFPGWKSPTLKKTAMSGERPAINKLVHQRLSSRFRHEACVLAAKRLKDKAEGGKLDARKVQWLRKICRPVE